MPSSSFSAMLDRDAARPNPARINAGSPEDMLRGRIQSAPAPVILKAKLSNKLDQRLGGARRFGFRQSKSGASVYDKRQRAIVKLHYFSHVGGGGALTAHLRYVAREAGGRDNELGCADEAKPAQATERDLDPHARYLARGGAREVFYDAHCDKIDPSERTGIWSIHDGRHFRVILSAENGDRLGDLKPYVREVMKRAEDVLGRKLDWFAIDHHDTGNPHTHLVLRAKDRDGKRFFIPKDFVKQGFRNIAREVATERLGERTRSQAREALEREARAHRPTRLDALLEPQIKDGRLRIGDVRAPDRDPTMTRALKTRARELQRLGLAEEPSRNVLTFSPRWREGLKAMELHLDIRKRLVLQRSVKQMPIKAPGRGLDR